MSAREAGAAQELNLDGVGGMSLNATDHGITFMAKGMTARVALGAERREIAYGDITARQMKPATRLVNGSIEVATVNGKSRINFRRKAGDDAQAIFELIAAQTLSAKDSTKDIGYTTKAGTEGPASFKEMVQQTRADFAAIDANMFAVQTGIHTTGDGNVTYQGVTQPIAGATAVIDTAGQISRRPTLTRVAVGTLLAGGVGAVAGGLTQKKTDSRQLFILIDGTEAAWAVPVNPDRYADAQRFVADFNTVAKSPAATSAERADDAAGSAEPSAPDSMADELANLARLHDSGVLTDEEFAAAKAKVLGLS